MAKEMEILRYLRRLEALSRRGKKEPEPAEGTDEAAAVRPGGRRRMLGKLLEGGPMSQAHLAAELEIRPQSLSELLLKTEEQGFIERHQSTEDKRQMIVSLTDTGRAQVENSREVHRRRAEAFLEGLDEDEKEELYRLLEKLMQAQNRKQE